MIYEIKVLKIIKKELKLISNKKIRKKSLQKRITNYISVNQNSIIQIINFIEFIRNKFDWKWVADAKKLI